MNPPDLLDALYLSLVHTVADADSLRGRLVRRAWARAMLNPLRHRRLLASLFVRFEPIEEKIAVLSTRHLDEASLQSVVATASAEMRAHRLFSAVVSPSPLEAMAEIMVQRYSLDGDVVTLLARCNELHRKRTGRYRFTKVLGAATAAILFIHAVVSKEVITAYGWDYSMFSVWFVVLTLLLGFSTALIYLLATTSYAQARGLQDSIDELLVFCAYYLKRTASPDTARSAIVREKGHRTGEADDERDVVGQLEAT